MNLVATAPLLVEPGERPLAEYALRVLTQCRFVTRASLVAALGPAGLLPQRIDNWVRAGLVFEGNVRLDPLDASLTAYLALTRAGARALAAATGQRVEARTPAMLRRPSHKRGHDVCVGELALAVLTLAREGQIELVGVECDDKKLAFAVTLAEPGAAPELLTLRPDAYIVARSAMGPVGFLVEVDRGTVSPKTMARRFRGYLAWQRDRGPAREPGRPRDRHPPPACARHARRYGPRPGGHRLAAQGADRRGRRAATRGIAARRLPARHDEPGGRGAG
jgi:hypothetical protein